MISPIPFLDLHRLNSPYMDRLRDAADRVVSSGRYIGGPEVESFENRLASYQNIPYIVGVSNGLDALRLILEGYKILGLLHPGDEVIVPANTYIASILAISHAGLKPVAVEPSAETLNLDTTLIEQAITPRTRAIMTVHLYGRTCWEQHLVDVARRHSLLVVEDNAQGIGALSDSTPGLHSDTLKTGSLGDAAAFSFYPTKNLGALGDAGAVATHDQQLADTVRALANYGSDRRYHNIYMGFNCRLDPMQAAMLNLKLETLDADNERRRAIVDLYASLVDNDNIRLCIAKPAATCNYHQFIALTERRDALRAHLDSLGIGTDIHYAVPPHMQPCYRGELGDSFPVTEYLADRVLSLPIAPYLTDDEVATVASALNSFR
ncbi:MAG: DegT/DnrJ/EryC1/StrS family aminotransferase [Muribaculaceae bacterium]|nr:DegT/DnrJ/EryC1/StrS family aminotransferase [Muribaculaceae bacterium]